MPGGSGGGGGSGGSGGSGVGGGSSGPSGLRLLFWLAVAILAHVLVALFGVLNRWLQVDPSPPLPAMRLAVIVSLMALGSVTVLDGTTRGLRWAQRAQQRRRHGLPVLAPSSKAGKARQHSSGKEVNGCRAEEGTAGLPAAANEKPAAAAAAPVAVAPNCCRISADGSQLASRSAVVEEPDAAAAVVAAAEAAVCPDGTTAAQHSQQQLEGASGQPASQGPAAPRPTGRSFALARQQAASFVQPGSAAAAEADAEPPPRPELALARGLSRRVRDLSTGRPRLVRLAALTVITSSFSAAYCCQIAAPGFVDPSLVQLVNMFTVLGVALVQSVLLRHRLPLSIWPCSAVMLGGAAMVIVPSIGSGTGAGLNGWRGWLGFGLSLASMATTVVYFVSLQASRRLGFTSLQLQYLYLLLSVAVLLPISLGVDGTDWPANFRGWTAADWAVLVVMSCCVVISANLCIQYSTWVLGAPTVSMFYGLRLVAAIVESNLILGTTVIKEPVQIAGTVITVCAVTVYMVLQWRRSKQQAQAEAGTGSPPSSSQLQAQEAAQPPLRQPAEP